MLRHQWQHGFEPFLLAGDGVDQRLAGIGLKASFKGGDDGTVDRQRRVGEGLHELDAVMEDLWFVGERYACVDVEHVGPCGHLGQGIGFDAAIVAVCHFGSEALAARGIDSLTDDGKRAVKADDDGFRRRTDHGLGHAFLRM